MACTREMSNPLDLSHHFSRVTNNRGSSAVKDFYKYFSIPGIQNLAGGLPNNNYFPFDTLEGAAALPDRFEPTPNDPPLGPCVGASSKSANDLTTSQVRVQYGTAQGYPPLYSFLRQFTRENMHPNVPYTDGPEIIITCGSTDGFSKTIEALSNVWNEGHDPIEDREGIVVEEFCYMNAIQAVRPRGLNIVPIGIDEEGMRSSGDGGLEDVLRHWDETKGKRPHLMYKYPSSMSIQRDSSDRWCNKPKSSGYAFLDSLIPSFLLIDTDGRVVRLDTFSKTVAPGCRVGWITAQPAVCEKLLRITETSTQQPSGFVQSMIAEMIMGPHSPNGRGGGKDDAGWKTDGWVRWLEGLRGNYERRMQTMCSILEAGKYLVKTGRRQSMNEDWSVVDRVQMFSFAFPSGGMFIWLRVHLDSHPLWRKTSLEKLSRALWVHLTKPEYLVLVAPGSLFAPTEEIRNRSHSYFRICFAAVDESELAPVSHRFVEGCKIFWGKKNVNDIDTEMEEEVEQHLTGMQMC